MAKGKSFIYLVRHGHAEDAHPMGDGARALTSDGRTEFHKVAKELAREIHLVGVATSPLVRAVQTAELLAMAFDGVPVQVCRELEPGSATPDSIDSLARRLGGGWALVGHNPSMGFALSHMLGLGGEAARFRKGAVAALEPDVPGNPWRLAWIVSPGRKRQKTVDLD